MEGIGLDNMMGAVEVEQFFGGNIEKEPDSTGIENQGEETPGNNDNSETEETAEVDFSDLLGNQPESVGSEETTEGNGETPESDDDPGTPQKNLFATIAKALRDEGVFPDLSDDTLKNVKDADTLRKMFDDEISKSLDDRQQRLEKALNSGATTDEMQKYQNAINLSQFLEDRNTYATLTKEGADGEELRKKMMYQDYVNRGFSHERAVRLVQKSLDDGNDIEDAKEAFESCKEYYKKVVDDFQQEMDDRQKKQKADEEKQFSNLKKHILDTDSFYNGVQVDKKIRQKAYDSITKPVFKDENGNFMNELQKYQRENPMEFMENVALLYALTDGFKSVEKLTKKKVQAGIKKGFEEVASVLNSTRRNGDGTLNLANTAPDYSDRENWTLA
jgi:hypothetical protein